MCTDRECLTYERLDVESLRRHDVANLFLGHGLEDGGFTCVIEAKHQDASFALFLFQDAQLIQETHFYFLL